ncbi:Choline-sulfatase [Pontiella sulfatireligans]|uniref:Choline-sulfatase n=2 Tax=Pontiella sulfatireligans TaxID=2750658 RepID=A0A6C2UGE4_9BACT|nr:sulfatase S1_7 [Kiritimatiellales bacterium]VGO19245.1 Choline-sulfatase [Pontiella sulfatireligans]
MKFSASIQSAVCALALLALGTSAALAGTLTIQEINQIESAFGITLTAQERTDLGNIVKPDGIEAWRSEAQARIDAHRKANLDIQVVDSLGNPVQGAQVEVKLNKNAFKFGGVATAADLTDGDGNLSAESQTAAYWQNFTSNMFNSVGCNNAFKPKITSQHSDLPAFTNWAANNNIDVRAHLLMWPGGGTTNDLGGVAGTDYGDHLSTDSTSDYASYDIRGAIETYAGNQSVANRNALKSDVDGEIAEWAGRWNVYEWDVINETRGNYLLQQILGYGQETEWFNIASNNMADPDTKLFINENQIISAKSAALNSTYYTDRRDIYFTTIDRLVASNAPIHGVGFQNRYKWEHIDPADVYSRLDDFGSRYGLQLAGTEFEIKHVDGTFTPSDYTRAQMTEETMTVYYSHALATGLNAWDYMGESPSVAPVTADGTNEWKSAMAWYDGTVKLNALAWYYVHRIRYNSDAELASGLDGQTGLRAFKGDYDITVSYNGQETTSSLSLTNSESVVITLGSEISDSTASTVVDAWSYDGLTNGAGLAEGVSTGLVGGVNFGNDALASIQNEAVRWQSDGVDPSVFQGRNPSSYDGASNGLFQLSVDYLAGDFSATAALTNGIGRVGFGVRSDPGGADLDATFRVVFTSGGGSNALYRLETTDDLGNNQNIGTFSGSTLNHLGVRAVYNLDNAGTAGSFKVYYRHDGGSEVEAHVGQLPAGFNLDQLRAVVQTYNGGANWAVGDQIFTDNLILEKLGEAPAPFFTVDPINKPDAAQDTAYTGQTIAGTASNAVTYAKVAGPDWLSIASDGTLSGTPAGTDVGQNSWIVQVSNGFDADTAVLKINVTGAGGGGPGGNIGIIAGYPITKTDDAASDTIFAGVEVDAGDVVCIATAPNKTTSANLLSLTWSGTEGVDGHSTTINPGDNDGRSCYVFYTEIINSNSYTFTVDAAVVGLTAQSSLFVLRAGSGLIEVGDEATLNANTASPGLSYDFSPETLPEFAITIESYAAKNGAALSKASGYAETQNANGRHIVYSTNVTGSVWNKAHGSDAGALNYVGAGAVFYEKTSGAANTPPTFGSDPIEEAGAYVDTAYTGSTLASHASDGDLDAMTFSIVSGPSWLTVAPSTGALAGTPLATDLGSNSWKVSVSDGTATNFATLHISVGTLVTPYTGTNVLFIAIDDINPILGCYGNTLIETPNIDSLAARGMLFENAHCQWSVCGPSRASLMTGLMPEQGGVMGFVKMRGDAVNNDRDNDKGVTNLVTIPQHFINHGYATAASGKINDYRCVGTINPDGTISEDGGSVDDPPSWSNGFSSPSGVGSTTAVRTTDAKIVKLAAESVAQPGADFTDGLIATAGLAQLNALATGNKPFFLGVGFKKPHLPFLAPASSWSLYDDSAFSPAAFPDKMLNATTYTFNNIHELRDNYYLELSGTNALPITDGILPDDQQRTLQHGYYACISHVDEQVGRVLDELDALGLADNTIIVLWGDHGFHLGDHNEWGKHSNLEQATRVPFIISAPGYPAGQKTDAPVGLLDIYPTLCELAGLPVPEQPPNAAVATNRPLAGLSLVPVLADPDARVQTGVVNHYGSGTYGYAYRTDRYRYTEWIDESGTVQARELYDYEQDPLETINLAGETGYEGLVYQFSRSMRYPTESGGCDRLKASTAPTAPANKSLAGLVLDGDQVSWPDAAGVTYNVMTTTNLVDGIWTTNQTTEADSYIWPMAKPEEFIRVDVSE